MYGFEKLAIPLTNTSLMNQLLQLLDQHILYAFLVGILITSIVQSSTVVTGIAMSFLNADIFPLEIGIVIMLGANIGTCVTGLLASIGAGEEARLTAFAHVWLNVDWCCHLLAFYYPVSTTPVVIISTEPDAQLAHASIIFNCVSSLLVLPFAVRFGKFVAWIHGKR